MDEDVSEAVPVGVPVDPPNVMPRDSAVAAAPSPGIALVPFVSLVGSSEENLMSGESALLLLLLLLFGVRLLLLLLLDPVPFPGSELAVAPPLDGLLYDCGCVWFWEDWLCGWLWYS